jgi:GAF domain-containing protein
MIDIRTSPQTDILDPLVRLRVRFIQALAIAGIFSSLGGIIAQLSVPEQGALFGLAITSGLALASGVVLWLTANGRIELASILLIAAFSLSLLVVNVIPVMLILGVLTLIFAAAMPNRYIYYVVNAVVFGKMFYELARIIAVHGFEPTTEGLYLTTTISALVVVSVATRLFINSAETIARASGRTADLLRSTAEIGQITSNLLKQDELFNRAVELIRDRFDFYHVQIFMIDEERKFARLVASTGEIGQKLLERGHKLSVGSQSVIGRVTQIGEIVIARDTDNDAVHAVNELLPSTRSELALPIVDGDRIIGALDVQSTQRNAFSVSDIQALQAMTNQLATVIRNARLFEEREANVELSQRLLLEARTNLREIQRLNMQLSKKAWEDYLSSQAYETGVALGDTAAPAEWTPEMINAVQSQRPISRMEDERRVTAVPIVLRGEVLGAIEVEAHAEREHDLIEMVQAVAQNLATSLESARLFEEAQEAAAQEQRINAIVEKYQSASTVDELLKITVDELSRTFGSEQGVIRVGNLSKQPREGSLNGSLRMNGSGQHG